MSARPAGRFVVSDPSLTGHIAVVSGAARGLGAEWVRALRGAGATVVGFDVRPGADLLADVSVADEVHMVDQAVEEVTS